MVQGFHSTAAVCSPPSGKTDGDQTNDKTSSSSASASTSSSASKDKEDQSTLKWTQKVAPGLALTAGTAVVGFSTASWLSDAVSIPLSGIPVSILLGMGLRNIAFKDTLPILFQPGLTVATKTVLQMGIVCVAAKLSLVQVWQASAASLPVVVASVSAGMLYLPWASQAAGLSPTLGRLLAAGTSICGVTAITALAPAIHASNRDISIAVANTVAFGTAGMLLYPYLFHALCGSSPEQVGLCLGVAIHDTSQVLGAALLYKETYGDELALQTAAVTKLVRNLGLAVCLPTITFMHHKDEKNNKEQKPQGVNPTTLSGLPTFSKFVPAFLWGFLGMSLLRSTGDALDLGTSYEMVMNFIGNDVSKYCLGTAMAAVGWSTSAKSLQGVGWKPFVVGGSGALVVGGTGFIMASAVMSATTGARSGMV